MGKKLKGKLAVGLPIKGYVIKIIINKTINNNSNNSVPLFDKNGHVTLESISNNREEFIGKTIEEIGKMLEKFGYTYEHVDSNMKKFGSKAKILKVTNPTKERNISQVQVSPGSNRHGMVPYVKISTTDIGKIKIIDSNEKDYVSDGKETAKLIFRRKSNVF